jgi:hypothetical protein
MALAQKGVAAVRALWRSPWTAVISFSQFPRAPSSASYSRGGVGATKEVPTKRGLAPAAITSALRRTRHGWAQAAAA